MWPIEVRNICFKGFYKERTQECLTHACLLIKFTDIIMGIKTFEDSSKLFYMYDRELILQMFYTFSVFSRRPSKNLKICKSDNPFTVIPMEKETPGK